MNLQSALEAYDICLERLSRANEQLERAKMPYSAAIQILTEAMEADDTVIQAQQIVDEYKDILTTAQEEVSNFAIHKWKSGETGDRKEWVEGNWEVRLRTIRTPMVKNLQWFITDVHNLRLHSIIKSITFNKKDAADVYEQIDGGVKGMEVEEKTTCSVRKNVEQS